MGVIVPHAGWVCSGAIAAGAIAAAADKRPQVDLVVVFGAIHTPIPIDLCVLDSYTRWALPGADSLVAATLRDRLRRHSRFFTVDDRFHQREHAIEVELPFIQAAWPNAQILPVQTPPSNDAVEAGRLISRAVLSAGLSAAYVASSDLTHYGPSYEFAPAGVGEPALDWALENDRRLLQVVTNLMPERIVPEALAHHNACGPGAIAAMLSACLTAAAMTARVLEHRNSYQVLSQLGPQSARDAVGYAAVLVSD